jgi:hypothetical protein
MEKQRELISVFALAFAVALLLPGLSIAGSLEPPSNAVDQSGNPVSTMKTLDQIPPTWSQKLPCDTTACPRFEIVMDGVGVLDKETGLVWQRYPYNFNNDWEYAVWFCDGGVSPGFGGRGGWRLPTMQELASLVDATQTNPALPSGHPFEGVSWGFYWSATAKVSDPNSIKGVNMGNGLREIHDKGSTSYHWWCVRGGQGPDLQ